jgi:hypothetical protein
MKLFGDLGGGLNPQPTGHKSSMLPLDPSKIKHLPNLRPAYVANTDAAASWVNVGLLAEQLDVPSHSVPKSYLSY